MESLTTSFQTAVFVLLILTSRAQETESSNGARLGSNLTEIVNYMVDNLPEVHNAQEKPRVAAVQDSKTGHCRISAADPSVHTQIQKLLSDDVKLITYNFLRVGNWTPKYPLATWGWARVSNYHGQTLLSMEYTYGLMSLMTLTIGQVSLDVELNDEPPGCARDLSSSERNQRLMDISLRDFSNTSESITLPARICHEVIVNHTGVAKFGNRCCYKSDVATEGLECEIDSRNLYLNFLYFLLDLVRYLTMLCGPALLVKYIIKIGEGIELVPYKVHRPDERDPMTKSICVTTAAGAGKYTGYQVDHVMDLTKETGWPKFHKLEMHVLKDTITNIKITEYNVIVSHDNLVRETYVPVGPWSCLYRTLFRCKLSRLGPFIECCRTRLFKNSFLTWNDIARKIGAILLIGVLPWPYYLRLIVYFVYENDERSQRIAVTQQYGLKYSYEHSILTFLSPLHWSFILMYIVCFVSLLLIMYLMTRQNEQCIRKILIDSFFDYNHLYWTKVWKLFAKNLVFPLKRFKLCGFFVGLIYWPVIMPLTVVVCLWYLFPTTYLIYRMIHHSVFGGLRVVRTKCKIKRYKTCRKEDKSLEFFMFENWMMYDDDEDDDGSDEETASDGHVHHQLKKMEKKMLLKPHDNLRKMKSYELSKLYNSTERSRKFTKYLFAVLLCVVSTLIALLLLSECIGFLVEMIVFTLMGLIINAGFLIRYVTFFLLLGGYTMDSFNNVKSAYHRLNKAIFLALQGRLEDDLNAVTADLPNEQENTGFIVKDALTSEEKMRIPQAQSEGNMGTQPTENSVCENQQGLTEDTEGQNRNVVRVDETVVRCHSNEQSDSDDSDDSDFDFVFTLRKDYDSVDGLRPSKFRPKKIPPKYKLSDSQRSHFWNINDLVVFMDNRDVPRIPRKLFDEMCNVRMNGLPGPLYESYTKALKNLGMIVVFLLFVALAIRSFGIYYKTSVGTDLILTVISGFIPLFIGKFLHPKTTPVEARTMNFKTRLNHILSNYNEWWPVYDFPFEVIGEASGSDEKKLDYLIIVNDSPRDPEKRLSGTALVQCA